MRLKLPITVAMLSIFLLVGSFGVMAMSNHHHEPGCPFMPGEQAICSMNALDHLTAWQNAFTVTLPNVVLYILLAAAVLFIWKYFSPPDLFVRQLLYNHRREHLPAPLYQELLSGGILNPRAP